MDIEISKIIDELSYNSKLVLTMFFISLIVLIINLITRGKSNELLFESYRGSVLNPLTYLRMFTYVLGHANYEHFMNNYVTILLIGPLLEEKYGSLDLLIMVLITTFIVGAINNIVGKHRITGASCIVFMMIVLASFSNITVGKIPITLVLILLFYVVNEIVNVTKLDGVSHIGHIIGALCGGAFGYIYMNYGTLLNFYENLKVFLIGGK